MAAAPLKDRIRSEYQQLLDNFANLVRSARFSDDAGEATSKQARLGLPQRGLCVTSSDRCAASAALGRRPIVCPIVRRWRNRCRSRKPLLSCARDCMPPGPCAPMLSKVLPLCCAGARAWRADGGVCGEDAAGLPHAAGSGGRAQTERAAQRRRRPQCRGACCCLCVQSVLRGTCNTSIHALDSTVCTCMSWLLRWAHAGPAPQPVLS